MTASPERYDVYISYNQKDVETVRQLTDRLSEAGVRVWYFGALVGSGVVWSERMKLALHQSACSAVFVGAAGLGPQQSEEVLVNIRERAKESGGRFLVIPVLLPGADETRLPSFLRERNWVDFRAGLDDDRAFSLLLSGIRGAAAGVEMREPDGATGDEAPAEGDDDPDDASSHAAWLDSFALDTFEKVGITSAQDTTQRPANNIAVLLKSPALRRINGINFSRDVHDALSLAGVMSFSANRPVDSTLLLAGLLGSAPPNLKHAGYSFLTALQAQRPSSKTTTAGPDVIELLKLTEYDLVEIPRADDRQSKAADVAEDAEALLLKAAKLARDTSSAGGTVRARHVLGAVLAPSDPDDGSPALKRLERLGYDVEKLRADFLSHVERYHVVTYDAWKAILPAAVVAGDEKTSAAPPPASPEPPTPEPTPPPTLAPDAPEEVGRESIQQSNISDQPTPKDSLGFGPYVKAIATFLNNEKTQPPLTLSVEGEWGSGKSSFMLQLREELREAARLRRRWGVPRRLIRELPEYRLINFSPLHAIRPLERLLLRRRIRRAAARVKCLTVEFNPWRHDKEDALWASFALEFVRKLSGGMRRRERVRAYFRLLLRRFSWKGGWLVLLRLLFLVSIIAAMSVALIQLLWADGLPPWAAAVGGDDKGAGLFRVVQASGVAGYVAVALFFLSKFREFVGNPFAFDLRRYVEAPDYEGHIAFIEQFHEDFDKIVETYAGGNKVYVFIDDLDRCDVPKAADLMQAINLMISGGATKLIFIIGMDREKVAAGLAVKNEKLLPYLTQKAARPAAKAVPKPTAVHAGAAAPAPPAQGVTFGLEYGYNFIEKFIQIPFRVPQPAQMGVRQLLDFIAPLVEVAADGAAKTQAAASAAQAAPGGNGARPPDADAARDAAVPPPGAGTAPATADALKSEREAAAILRAAAPEAAGPSAEVKPTPLEKAEEEREGLMLLEKGDSLTVRNIVLMAAPALDYNPRRIKQFINLFRLKAYIAYETGLFRRPPADSPYSGLTLEQLGKFVAIGLRWPRLLADLDDDHGLLQRLQGIANGGAPEAGDVAVAYWQQRPELMSLLKFSPQDGPTPSREDRPADPDRYSLARLDVHKLLRVSPSARRAVGAAPHAAANVPQATLDTPPNVPTATAAGDVSAEAAGPGADVVEQAEAPPN